MIIVLFINFYGDSYQILVRQLSIESDKKLWLLWKCSSILLQLRQLQVMTSSH